jgi:integrase/recombinase XerD
MKQLLLKTQEYEALEAAFREWLSLLGYSEATVYNLPNHLREFLHWLENLDGQGITDIKNVQASPPLGVE